jgi:alkylation response protein AidB-like acyl-CoA dehydrogenase
MIDFSPTEEQKALRDGALRFAREALDGRSQDADPSEFPRAKWALAAEFGLLGLLVPPQYGGMGCDCATAALVLDAVSYGCRDHGFVHAVCTQIVCSVQLTLFGSIQQREELLPPLCAGRIVASQAMTEPEAGSDTSSIRTTAVKRGGGSYVLNGRKTFISNGPLADLALVFAVTNPAARTLGRSSCFLVPADAPGFSRGPAMQKMGLNSLQNGDLEFTDCTVSTAALLGSEGGGASIFSEAMEWERILLSAALVGKTQRVLEATVAHAKSRRQFGRPIGEFQAIAHRIADMRTSLELGRLMVHKAAWLKDSGARATLESSLAKLHASESCKAACLEAVQMLGGYGYFTGLDAERELRDSIASTIYSGTSEIQKNIIAALSGL